MARRGRFNSALHPRDRDGKFKRKGGISSSKKKSSRPKTTSAKVNRSSLHNKQTNTTHSANSSSNKKKVALIAGAVVAAAAIGAAGYYAHTVVKAGPQRIDLGPRVNFGSMPRVRGNTGIGTSGSATRVFTAGPGGTTVRARNNLSGYRMSSSSVNAATRRVRGY